MTYQRFEDLPVWKAAMEFAVRAFAMLEDRAFIRCGDVRDQLERASLSISNNIAEGFERGSTAELLMFLYIARGSAGESRNVLRFCDQLPRCNHLKSQLSDLIQRVIAISRQIRGWTDSLQNSDIKGQRHLNDQTRGDYDQTQRTQAFMLKLQEIRDRGRRDEERDPNAEEPNA